MLQYDISKGIDPDKSDKSKECIIGHYCYFKEIGYEYEPHVCNECHDLSMMVYDLNDFMNLDIKGVDHRCFMLNMSKSGAIKLLNNTLLDNQGVL